MTQAGSVALIGSATAKRSDAAVGERPPGLFDRGAWRDALLVWGGQHLVLLVALYVGGTLLLAQASPAVAPTWDHLLRGWLGWDGSQFSRVASGGYQQAWQAAYYPVLPALEHVFAGVAGGNAGVAGLIISNVAGLGAFGLVRVLVERELGRAVAQRSLLYLAVFPTAFFLDAPYAESLFLLWSVAAFLALRRGWWVRAGALAALATLTRPVGILLLAPLAVEMALRWRAGGTRPRMVEAARALVGLALPPAALVGYGIYLTPILGHFSILGGESSSSWERGFTLPLLGFARAGGALIDAGLAPGYLQVHILTDAAFTVLFIGLTVATWRRLPLPYVAYAAVTLLLVLCTPAHSGQALASNMRFMLVVFPLFMVLGLWGERRNVERVVLGLSLPLLVLFALIFANQGWVA